MTVEFGEINGVEIFRTGTWKGSRSLTVTSSMLDEMVQAFSELSMKVSGYVPPIKLGHTDAQRFLQQSNGAPALGWVAALRRVGDTVVADFKDVPSSLIDLIRKRLYNSVSIELMPKVEYAGQTFKNVLSAVAVLGAELPAVKGLKELSASLFDATVSERVLLSEMENKGPVMANENVAMFTQVQVDALVSAAVTNAKAEFGKAQDATLVTVTKERDDAKVALTAAQAETKVFKDKLATFASDAAKASIAAVVDQAVKEGKLLPADKDSTLAFAQTLDTTSKIKFGETEMSPFEHWKKTLLAGKAKVKLGERTTANLKFDAGDKAADAEVAERAREKQATAGGEAKMDFATAVSAVLAEDPDLKARYVALA